MEKLDDDQVMEKLEDGQVMEKLEDDQVVEKLEDDKVVEKLEEDQSIEKFEEDQAMEKLEVDQVLDKVLEDQVIEKLLNDQDDLNLSISSDESEKINRKFTEMKKFDDNNVLNYPIENSVKDASCVLTPHQLSLAGSRVPTTEAKSTTDARKPRMNETP